jgi:hypothetical protein
MADTPDTAQRLAEIREQFDRPVPAGCRLLAGAEDVRLMFDHIDTLTGERDALRALADDLASYSTISVPSPVEGGQP